MSVWGKVLGGAAGFALGGPLGAMIGAVAGHAVDRMRDAGKTGGEGVSGPTGEATRQVAFTIGVIVLGAKMAKADGVVTRAEIGAFREVFHIPEKELKNVGRLFDRARRDATGFEPYAKQLARLFRDKPAVLEELLHGLFHIARADGQVKEEELAYLRQIAEIFGFDEAAWARIRAANMGPDESDPYDILGVTRENSDAEIKSAHRKLVLENHPDRLVSQGMPQEFIDMANEKLATVNAAYDEVRKQRGFT